MRPRRGQSASTIPRGSGQRRSLALRIVSIADVRLGNRIMPKYVVEFIGTFFLVLTIGCAVMSPGAGDMAPVAIGSALMVMIFAGGHISGGHFNPAVTLAVFLRGRCDAKDVPAYMISQVAGAVLAAFAAMYLKTPPSEPKALQMLPSLVA